MRVIARLNIGGPATHVALVDAGLRARGYCTLLLHGDPGPREGSLECLVAQWQLPAVRVRGLGRRISPLSDLRAFVAVTRKVFELKPDIVHTHTAKAGVVGRLAALLYNASRRPSRRCLVVHTYHGNVLSGYFGAVGSALVRAIERMMALGTDRVVVVSEQQRTEIVDRLRIAPASKVRIVPLGLHLDPFLQVTESSAMLRSELRLEERRLVLGFVGRLVPIKDPATLLEAFVLVRRELPDALLLLAGDGPLRAGLEALAASRGVARAVRFLGWRHDLPALYRTLDVVVLSSLNEGTPVSVIEGMASARAVVATDVGGVRDLIEHGRTGLLVPAGNPRALAAAAISLARDPAMRTRLGVAARQSVARRYRASRLVDDIDELYRGGLSARRHRTQVE